MSSPLRQLLRQVPAFWKRPRLGHPPVDRAATAPVRGAGVKPEAVFLRELMLRIETLDPTLCVAPGGSVDSLKLYHLLMDRLDEIGGGATPDPS